ncbi:MAG TPA: GNAT family N-acetyltransferase [Bacteroidales bacterium]|nr:GNAT family N-acetyltransferase [Bacteroidales bacterium]
MNTYRVLHKQTFVSGQYSIVPIRMEDRWLIMQWRNEQIYHLRQQEPLTEDAQDAYFNNVISALYDQRMPSQVLFSFLENGSFIGYGGLVHIDHEKLTAEISFIMDTALEKEFFVHHWSTFLSLIEKVAFEELGLHTIFTYAYNLRPRLYEALEACGFKLESKLPAHVEIDGVMTDVLIHSKRASYYLRSATAADVDITFKWASDKEIRKYSFSQQKIEYSEHERWFTNKINDASCEYYILCSIDKCIGSIRFEMNEKNEAMISYLIDSGFHGKGFGTAILKLGIQMIRWKKPHINSVYGMVKSENPASVRIFEKLGFTASEADSGTLRFDKTL